MLQDIHSYARGHLKHHQHAGTEQDPDLSNYRSYPVSKDSFKRKVQRDLTGKTGWKLMKLILNVSTWIFSDDKEKRKFARPFVQELFVQLVFIAVLTIFMSPWLYVLWIASWLTTYMLVVRLRQVAEHGAVENLFDLDPRRNTRTTIATGWSVR
jgi:fatty acid desaturase